MLRLVMRTNSGRLVRLVASAALGALLVAAAPGCGKKDSGGPQGRAGHAGGPPAGRGNGHGGPGGEPPAHVAVETVERGIAVSRYSTTATLEAENRAEILARTGGVLAKLLVEEGDPVREGQELLVLDDSEARLRLRQAEVELAKQHAIFERQKSSFEKQLISQADFDLAKTSFEAAEAQQQLSAHDLSYTCVKAPFRGTVVRRMVNVGQTVNIGTPLFEIANFDPLLARIYVPAKDMGTLAEKQEARVVLSGNSTPLHGTVNLVSPVVDPATGTVKVTVSLREYPAGTRPGDFVQVSVVTAQHDNALRVPNLAVFEDKGERIVYVARDSVAERRAVEIGFIEETHTEIQKGLAAGDQVIVKGQRSLKDGAPIRILEGGSGETAQTGAATAVANRKGS